jgi:hypothetical protein
MYGPRTCKRERERDGQGLEENITTKLLGSSATDQDTCIVEQLRRAEVDVHADGDEEDGGQGEEEHGVDEDGKRAGMVVAELDEAALGGHLEEQARRQQDEEQQRDEHGPPVLHLLSLFSCRLFLN